MHKSRKERRGEETGGEGKGDIPESFAWSTGNLGSWTWSNLLSKSWYTVMCFGKFFTSWKKKTNNKKNMYLHVWIDFKGKRLNSVKLSSSYIDRFSITVPFLGAVFNTFVLKKKENLLMLTSVLDKRRASCQWPKSKSYLT